MEQFFLQYETTITVCAKIFATIGGVGLIIRFTYRFTLKFFDVLVDRVAEIESTLWGPEGDPEKGMIHSMTELKTEHDLIKGKCKKRCENDS